MMRKHMLMCKTAALWVLAGCSGGNGDGGSDDDTIEGDVGVQYGVMVSVNSVVKWSAADNAFVIGAPKADAPQGEELLADSGVFTAAEEGGVTYIYVLPHEGAEPTKLTHESELLVVPGADDPTVTWGDTYPVWFPDPGRRTRRCLHRGERTRSPNHRNPLPHARLELRHDEEPKS